PVQESASERIPPQFNFATVTDPESRRMSIVESSPVSVNISQAPSLHGGGFSAPLHISKPKQIGATDTYIDPGYLQLHLDHPLPTRLQQQQPQLTLIDAQLHGFDAFRRTHSVDELPPELIQDFSMHQSSTMVMTPLSIMASLRQAAAGQPAEWQHPKHQQIHQDNLQLVEMQLHHNQQQMMQLPYGSFSSFFNVEENPAVVMPSPSPPPPRAAGGGDVGDEFE
ncbi:hypothetical protein HDU82_001519, partial [Entophlyctis luteolus]